MNETKQSVKIKINTLNKITTQITEQIARDLLKEGYRLTDIWSEEHCKLVLSRMDDDSFDKLFELHELIQSMSPKELSFTFTDEFVSAILLEKSNRIFEKGLLEG